MSGFEGIRRVFRLGIGGGDAEREVERELAHHREATLEELRGRGLSEAEARAEARRRFGDEGRYARELRRLARGRERRAWAVAWLAEAWSASKGAARGLARAPGLALGVVAIIALGVGVNAAMFSVLDRIFLRPPALVEDAEEVRRFFVHRQYSTGQSGTDAYHPYPHYRAWSRIDAFESTAAYSPTALVVRTEAGSERRPVTLATGSLFPLLGVEPALGRFYTVEEDRIGGERVAVLGHDFWRTHFGSDVEALGRTLEVDGATYTIIGVAPRGFTGANLEPVSVWLPFHAAGELVEGGTEWVESANWYWFQAIARLKDGEAPEAAEARATTGLRALRSEDSNYDPDARVELASLILARTSEASAEAKVVPWLMGVAVMVLLLTCANVANLLLARGTRRQRDTAVQLALGAGRRRVVGTAVVESVLLALAGGAAALLLAGWGGDLLRTLMLPDVAWHEDPAGHRVFAFGIGVAVVAGVLSGLLPALRASRPDVVDALKSSGRGVLRGRSALRNGLLVAQAAITVVLLIGTGLFVVSLQRARDVDLGFDPSRALLVRLEPEGGYPGGEVMRRMYLDARERLRGVPGIDVTAISTTTPFRNNRGVGLRVPGLDSIPSTEAGGAYINTVTGGYFEAMGIDVLRGRPLTDQDDRADGPRVAVVNETFARMVWPNEDPLGKCLLVEEAPCATVVGVVEEHRRYALVEAPTMDYFLPLSQAPYEWPPSRLVVGTANPAALARPVVEALTGRIAGVQLVTAETYAEVVDPSYRSWQLGAALFTAFGLLALVVAALGLYSVLSFDVAQRRPELGIRSALGAERGSILRLVLRDGLRLAGLGTAIGLATGAFAATRAEPLLFRVEPLDPIILAAVAAVVMAVAAVAAGLPAWRAARVDPNQVLRTE